MNLFFQEIQNIIQNARNKSQLSVNFAMIEAYWKVGKRIFEEEQGGTDRAEYGKSLIKQLSKHLISEFGKGFSEANLWNFRQFYKTFPAEEKLYALRRELSWTHYRLIMRVENLKAMDFYIRESAENNWSTRQLERNINSLYYERLLSTKNKKLVLANGQKMERMKTEDFIKDPYVLEFLGLPAPPEYTEVEFETAIIRNLQQFLLELGKGFSFVGRQYRITTETKHFFIDLVFYNFILKCFILIDLKIGELTHQDIGQMDMYIRLFEDRVKGADDNPTIGIIFCTEKDETIVKYSILEENKQLFASKYKTILPTEDELMAELEREKNLIRQSLLLNGKKPY